MSSNSAGPGPMAGPQAVTFRAIGPVPFVGMPSDLGPDVVRIDRSEAIGRQRATAAPLGRERRSIAVDPKAPAHPHDRHRRTFVKVGGRVPGGPAPRFCRTPGVAPASDFGEQTAEILRERGMSADEIDRAGSRSVVR